MFSSKAIPHGAAPAQGDRGFHGHIIYVMSLMDKLDLVPDTGPHDGLQDLFPQYPIPVTRGSLIEMRIDDYYQVRIGKIPPLRPKGPGPVGDDFGTGAFDFV